MNCLLLNTEQTQLIVGDASRRGVGGQQYCGVWSLTSSIWPFNSFGGSYAGLIPGELRGLAPTLAQVDARTARLTREPTPTHGNRAEAWYRVHEPNLIEHWLVSHEAAEARQHGCAWREYSWCSYSNSPSDPRLHFPGADGQWVRYLSPRHGVGSRLAPTWEPTLETFPATLPPPPPGKEARPFHWDWAPVRFSEPLYYTRFGPMVLIHVFAERAGLRFYCSPSGGGPSLLPGQTCPAWDFCWVIPGSEYQVGRRYQRRMALVYQPFVSDAEVLATATRVRAQLGFDQP